MKFSETKRELILSNRTRNHKNCLQYLMNLIEAESAENGEYSSIQDFIVRMLNANMDIHAFSVLEKDIPITFPNNGDSTMLRPMLSLMGYDPDYSAAPQIEIYPSWHFIEDDDDNDDDFDDYDDELPFN